MDDTGQVRGMSREGRGHWTIYGKPHSLLPCYIHAAWKPLVTTFSRTLFSLPSLLFLHGQ